MVITIFLKKRLRKQSKGKLVLTFDDGPGIRLERQLLKLLKTYDVEATFFLNAERALTYPERFSEMKEAGHEVCCHCFRHYNAWTVPIWKIIVNIHQANQILDRWLTNKRLYRFPYGKFTTCLWLVLKIQGRYIALWTHDSGDTHRTLPQIEIVLKRILQSKGGVVLLHSFDRNEEIQDREGFVLTVTKKLLEMAEKEHWQVCPLSDLYKRSDRRFEGAS